MKTAPVLSAGSAKDFEANLFGGDEKKEWAAMSRAGAALGRAAIEDFRELGGFPAEGRLLILVGKGHNGGDALLAAQMILEQCPHASADIVLAFGDRVLRPLAARAYRELLQFAAPRIRLCGTTLPSAAGPYDLSLDGVFGFQFRPPVEARVGALFATINALTVRLRAAVDLPSGLGTKEVLRADFTYATGIAKETIFAENNRAPVGRLRYLDLGFFSGKIAEPPSDDRLLTNELLGVLGELRPAVSDKRSYGHLFILGGSRSYPGAVLMSTLAALRTGLGLVTTFVPESLAAAYAARVPEAMWVGWPETPAGGLSLEGLHLLRERVSRASAILIGPGLSSEPEVLALAGEVVKMAKAPLAIDADALQSEIIRAGTGPRILTPHAGEFARIAGGVSLRDFVKTSGAITVLKSSLTQVSDGHSVYYSPHGGPVLARGGSGDLLAGMIAGLLAQGPTDPLLAACRGVVWHGMAADALARTFGSVAVQTTQLLDFLGETLRSSATWPLSRINSENSESRIQNPEVRPAFGTK